MEITISETEMSGLVHVTNKTEPERKLKYESEQNLKPVNQRVPYVSISPEDYLRLRISEILARYIKQEDEDILSHGLNLYKNADPATKASIKSALGVNES